MLIIRKTPSRPKPEPNHTIEGGGGVKPNHNTPQGERDPSFSACVCVCACVCICMYVYIYIYRERERGFCYACNICIRTHACGPIYRPQGDAITTCADLACTDAKNPK